MKPLQNKKLAHRDFVGNIDLSTRVAMKLKIASPWPFTSEQV
jgi:hypothetical protein